MVTLSQTILSCHGTEPAALQKYILRYSLCCFPTTLSMFPPPTACCTSPICTSSLHAPGTMLWSSSSASICPRSKLAYLILMRLCRQMHAVTTIFTTFVVWSIVLSKHRQRDVRMPNAFSTTQYSLSIPSCWIFVHQTGALVPLHHTIGICNPHQPGPWAQY